MPSVSERGKLMPASPIRKLVPFAEAAKKKQIKVYHLNIGQPDIETPKIMMDAYRNTSLKVLEYGHSAGLESYRKKLADYYRSHQIEIDYSDIIITTGGSEALIFALMACLNPGDEIIIPEPFYTNYNSFALQAGVSVKAISSSIENNFALPAISEFEKQIGPKTKAVMICNPGNPTGYVYSRKELEELRDLALKYDLFILSDEVYREFLYDGAHYTSIMHIDGLEDRAVLLDSISKRYSACGARVGAFISKNKELVDAALRLGQARLCPPTLEQIAATAAIDTEKSYFDNVIKEYSQRRDIITSALSQMKEVRFGNPKGAFYLIAELPVKDADHFCRWLLESFSYENQTVMLAPANGFYANSDLGKRQVRIAYVLNTDDLKQAMICLEKALEIYPDKI